MRYIQERLGYCETDKQQRIHVHAASVGEIITVLPLLEKMQLLNPELRFLVSTNTPTGSAILTDRLQGKDRLQDNVTQTYLPIDFPGATKRFFARKNITRLWVVETEIWPWLFSRAKQHNIPISLVNARLSHRSRGKLADLFKHTYACALDNVLVFARSGEDATRFTQRGAHPNNVSVVGNLKYAATENIQTPSALLTRAYVLAASTHEDEERQLAQAWLNSSVDQLLVIVPRHPERGAKLIKNLKALQQQNQADLPDIALRSKNQQPGIGSKLYLADTLGEMHHWYAHASAAFIGGSLIKRGGHNVLEPGRFAIPTIVGPHTFNFSEEVALLHNAQAIAKAENADEVIQFLTRAVSDTHWAKNLGKRAKTVINAQTDVVDRYIASLSISVSDNSQE